MKPPSHRTRFQQQQSAETQLAQTGQTGQEFASVEELLRHDAAQIQPPPALAQRLKASVAKEPKPLRSWWRRFFSRK